MRFLHLSTGDTRGAFTGAYRLHEGLQKLGHESDMYVLIKHTRDDRVHTPSGLRKKILQAGLFLYQKFWRRFFTSSTKRGSHYFFPYWSLGGAKALRSKYKEQPDLILVYYVANFLSADDLLEIQREYSAPVALYLMDVAMLTGGCHYTWTCDHFSNACGSCPALRLPHERDRSRQVWQQRNDVYRQMPLFSIAASSWLEEKISQSSLVRDMPVYRALLGVDEVVFKPRHKLDAMTALKINTAESKTLLYFGAQDIEEPRKGFSFLLAALEILATSIDQEKKKNICILTVGGNKPSLTGDFEHHHIEYISDKVTFASTYNAADLFICPSVEDAGPMMINESMMSGTPVVAFRVGVASDLVKSGETGFLADGISAHSLAIAITRFISSNNEKRRQMASACRAVAETLCTQSEQAKRIVEITEIFYQDFRSI